MAATETPICIVSWRLVIVAPSFPNEGTGSQKRFSATAYDAVSASESQAAWKGPIVPEDAAMLVASVFGI